MSSPGVLVLDIVLGRGIAVQYTKSISGYRSSRGGTRTADDGSCQHFVNVFHKKVAISYIIVDSSRPLKDSTRYLELAVQSIGWPSLGLPCLHTLEKWMLCV